MDIDQVRTAAETRCSYLNDPSCIKIYVASSPGDPDANQFCALLQYAMGQCNLPARIVRTGSFGLYDLEPILMTDAFVCNNANPERVADIVSELIQKKSNAPHFTELPLLNMQSRVALRNCGRIDPEEIDQYILRGRGYTGLSNALKMSPRDLLQTVIPGALRGRGEPGCSALEKWKSLKPDKCLICNIIDPDPKSLTSQLLLSSDPHSVLEGMLIGAYAAGASKCLVLLDEAIDAGRRIGKALDQMRQYNLVGRNILDSQYSSEIEIREVPASLSSGQRIGIFRCLEEESAPAHMLPTFPAAFAFAGKPVLIVNPEMMSSLSAAACNTVGESKVLTLSGSVVHNHTVEVPDGTTIGHIIEFFGGGVRNGKTIKAVQLGSPAGRFSSPDSLGDTIRQAGELYGSINVVDSDTRILNLAKDIMSDIQAQSCGKCVFCREGCLQLLTILEDISENRNKPQDLDLLVELGEEMRTSSLCAFGRNASIPVLSSVALFRNEYQK
jgi:NADH:ubiquinone oxidoreductase subunit F (NADH-binding)